MLSIHKGLLRGVIFLSAITGGCMSDRECHDRCDYRVSTELDQMRVKIKSLEESLCVHKEIVKSCPSFVIPDRTMCQ